MIELNSNILLEDGQRIIKLTEELETNIDYFYSRIEGMDSITGEWQGAGASTFIKNIKMDKKQTKSLLKALKSYGTSLVNQAEKIERCCTKVEL